MASEPAVLGDYAQLCTAPDHIVDMVLSLMPSPTKPDDIAQARSRRATARAWATRIWSEAAHAGATWGLSRAPVKVQLELKDAPALGDLIRQTGREAPL